MDFNAPIAEQLTGLFRAAGYTVYAINVLRGDDGTKVAEVVYDNGSIRPVNITMDGALAACYDIISAVGHFV